MHKRRTLIRLWVIVALPLLACSAATSMLFPLATPTNDHSSAILTIVGAEKYREVTTTPSPPPIGQTHTNTATPTLGIELGFELSDRELEASDPKDFVRAAGKPQVIELFAFW